MTENSPKGKVLPFAQNADFYARKGDERRERGALAEAAAFYRKAVELEPDDPDFRILLGCVYGEMGCGRLSNLLLASALWRGGREDALLYYHMGVNYFDYRLYDEAMACFQEMLGCDGVEELNVSPEISDFLEEESEDEEGGQLRSQCNQYTSDAVEALGRGEDEKAVALLEKAWALMPCSPEQACNLAMAYYCRKDFDRAMTVCNRAMLEDPGSLQLHCVLALLYRERGDEAAARREIDFLKQAPLSGIYEGLKVAVTLFDMGALEEARAVLEKLRAQRPYDVEVLQRLGICCYNLAEHEAAADCWKRARAIDPGDEVLRFYDEENKKALSGKKHRKKFSSCSYDLPMEETLVCLTALQTMQQEEHPSEREDWQRVMNWALRRQDQLRFAAASVLARENREEGEKIIRTMLCDCSAGLEDKHMLLMLLSSLDPDAGAVIFLQAGVADVQVSDFEDRLPKEYVQIPELFVRKLTENEAEQEVVGTGIGMWQQFINATFDDPVNIRPDQVPAFAAALSYAAKRVLDLPVTQKEEIEAFATTVSRFRRAENLLYDMVVRPMIERDGGSDDESD